MEPETAELESVYNALVETRLLLQALLAEVANLAELHAIDGPPGEGDGP